jgi:SAM-dependent methyltransferase
MEIRSLDISRDVPLRVRAELRQTAAVLFQPDVQIQVSRADDGEILSSCDLSAAGLAIGWLPRGDYRVDCRLPHLQLAAGDYRLRLIVFGEIAGERQAVSENQLAFSRGEPMAAPVSAPPSWAVTSAPGTVPLEELAWSRGHEDWFFRHFDHAALVVTDYLLQRHPLLRGRILDAGCGDGITDLGIFLRMQPRELVGIDPFRGFERLPGIVADNHLPADVLDDERLRFLPEDANDLSFPDDYFDVVVSWGSLEHMAGGYGGALREIRRVLKRDGLLFVHPGLYYGALGNHLGEFFDDPFIHLKLPEEQLREAVLGTRPRLIDRAGHDADPAQYWQWYQELNPIRVPDFERELRELGFEPWRVAVRSSDIIEYTPELQRYPMQDLATAELYLSAWNRK